MENLSHNKQRSHDLPLCVDVDGTLLRSDLLLESVLQLLKQQPTAALQLPLWLLKGRAFLKREISRRIKFDGTLLPLNDEVVSFLTSEAARGRQIILATALDRELAEKLASSLPFRVEVIASDGETNLKGHTKAKTLSARFGKGNFAYIGDANADLSVWAEAGEALIVSSNGSLLQKLKAVNPPSKIFQVPAPSIRTYIKALRMHQWVKNILVFVPLILAHQVSDSHSITRVSLAFFSFCFLASSVYLMNDLLDLPADRKHPTKRFRPFASGALPLLKGLLMLPLLVVAGTTIACLLPIRFGITLALYFVLNIGYSFYLKQLVLVDIVLLGAMYALRILAGAFATPVRVSEWLLAFALFFFFSLACMKRFSELYGLRQSKESHSHGRGYRADDLEQIGVFGSSSAFMSILVLALYVNSEEVRKLYSHPFFLWLLCPLLLYWVSRAWLIAHRGEMHDDPIVFALKEPTSYLVGACTLVIMLIAV